MDHNKVYHKSRIIYNIINCFTLNRRIISIPWLNASSASLILRNKVLFNVFPPLFPLQSVQYRLSVHDPSTKHPIIFYCVQKVNTASYEPTNQKPRSTVHFHGSNGLLNLNKRPGVTWYIHFFLPTHWTSFGDDHVYLLWTSSVLQISRTDESTAVNG